MESVSINPLLKHFRQPSIYIKLPSDGNFWPEGSLVMTINREFPVLPMTSKDEITSKTPDGLMNGSSVVSLIESCMPNIKNAWNTPKIDVDAILVAIKIASYGHLIEIATTCPNCSEIAEYSLDLRIILSNIKMPDYSQLISYDTLKIKLKPQPYSSINKVNMIRYEQSRILNQISDSTTDDEVRAAAYLKTMDNFSKINLDLMAEGTEYVLLDDNQVVDNPIFIREFYENADSKLTNLLSEKFKNLTQNSGVQPTDIVCEKCQHEYKSNLDFDNASFFDQGF